MNDNNYNDKKDSKKNSIDDYNYNKNNNMI